MGYWQQIVVLGLFALGVLALAAAITWRLVRAYVRRIDEAFREEGRDDGHW